MISKVLRQNDLYHNPDPSGRLVGEADKSNVIVEGWETRALLDSGSQLLAISWAWVKELNLKPQQFQSILQIEGSGGLEVPYLGYVEAHHKIPEIKAFDQDVLLLTIPNSSHTQCTPITLGTLHIDMAIRLATEKELKNLNKQWQRSLVATKLTMKEVQIVNIKETQIVSKLDSDVKLTKDITLSPFGTAEAKGVLKKTPTHYKRVNVVVDNLAEGQCCRDVAIVHQLQILKPGSDRIPVIIQNHPSRTLKLKKGTNGAHAETSQVVPSLDISPMQENISEKVAGNTPKSNLPENSFGEDNDRFSQILEKLDLEGIESWTEQQQQSVRKLLKEYQHLFALNLKELGKTSLVQHDIKLSDKTPFKE